MNKNLNNTIENSYTIGGPYYELPKERKQLTGWICPKCGAVMAPSMMWCVNCINDNKITNTAAENHIDISDWVKVITYTGPVLETKLR